MRAQEIIRNKQSGRELNDDEIASFVEGVVSGAWSEAQGAAMLMAMFLKGLKSRETVALTQSMIGSGETLDWSDIQGPVAGKHSTGGVGDNVSLILAPLAASLGVNVPMISGHGLGLTGGTLDKLESIPGYRASLTPQEFHDQVKTIGCAIVGQSEDLVPADRILYSLRDATATVESFPLICASILAKKKAEGINALVLDVKYGAGAFMKTLEEGRQLGKALVEIGNGLGLSTSALLTSMDQPLGRCVGNALEVVEAIQCLRGDGPLALREVTFELVAKMLRQTGIVNSLVDAGPLIEQAIHSGRALGKFRQMIEAQGGNAGVLEDPRLLPRARIVEDVFYEEPTSRYVHTVQADRIARIVMDMGAGRRKNGDYIDYAVGISHMVASGDWIEPGHLLGRIHANSEESLEEWKNELKNSIALSEEKPPPVPCIDSLIPDEHD